MNINDIVLTLQQPHVHLKRADIRILFGEGVKLTPDKELDMPGTFTAQQKVTVKGANGVEITLPVYGPSRSSTQVELNRNLARQLGIDAKVQPSGQGTTGGVTIIGDAGSIELARGVIIPQPHIHIPPEEASTLGLLEDQEVTLESKDGTIIKDAVVRVSHMCITRVHVIESEDFKAKTGDVFGII